MGNFTPVQTFGQGKVEGKTNLAGRKPIPAAWTGLESKLATNSRNFSIRDISLLQTDKALQNSVKYP